MTIETPLPDAALVGATLDGELEAFGELYDRHFGDVYDFLTRLLRDRHEAADVSQDAFVRTLERLPQLEKPESFRSWLFSVAYRLGLNRIEQRKRATLIEPASMAEAKAELISIDPDRLDDPARSAEAEETAELVWDLARELDDRSYAVLDLYVRQGLPSAEIAEVLGVTKGNASTMVSRTKRRLADSVGIYLLARRGSKDCEELGAILEGADIQPMAPAVRNQVKAHVKDCEVCQRTRRGLLLPTSILSALAVVPVPAGLMEQGRAGLIAGDPPSWHKDTAAGAAAGAGGLAALGTLLTSKAAVILAVVAGGAALAIGGWLGLANGSDGDGSAATVLGVQITAPSATTTPPDSAGGSPAGGATTTTTTPTAAGGATTTTTTPPTTTSTTTTTSPTTTTTTTVPAGGGGGGGGGGTTTTTSTTTTTVPATTTTTTTTVPLPPATDPGDVSSTSHIINVATTANVVTVVWTPVPGALGYSVEWSPDAPVLPDQVVDLPGGASQAVSPPLAPGNWYFNLRTMGPGGDWTSTVQLGPFIIAAPPVVESVTINRPWVFELECPNPQTEADVKAEVLGDDVATVRATWFVADRPMGSQSMTLDQAAGTWSASLTFPQGTADPKNPEGQLVEVVVTATSGAGLSASGTPAAILVLPCSNSVEL